MLKTSGCWRAATCRWAVVVLLLATSGRPLSAAVALLVHEPIGVEGELLGAGHASVYLSNVCSDDGTTLRHCRPGERGVVVSTYPDLLPAAPTYWLAVPFDEYLFGARQDTAPIYATRALVSEVRRQFGRHHPRLSVRGFTDDGETSGTWPLLIGNALQRTVYSLSAETSVEQDALVMAALHDAQTRQAFDLSYNNCSDFARFVLNTYFPGAARRDALNDLSFTSPKAIARSWTQFGQARPELDFRATRYRQIDGSIARSRPNRLLMEKLLTSRKYAALTLILNPTAVTVFAGLYETGRFTLEDAIRANRPADETATAVRELREALDARVRRAIRGGVFRDRRAAARFADELTYVSVPEYDARGWLRLRIGAGDRDAIVGLTRAGLQDADTDPSIGRRLVLSLAVRALDRRDAPPATRAELEEFQQLLTHFERRADAGGRSDMSLRCPAGSTCPVPARPSVWKRLLLFLSR